MTFRNMDQVKRANAAIGEYWFSPATMDAWGSVVESELIGGHWFVTSENGPDLDDDARVYSVRFTDDEGYVRTAPGTTVGQFEDEDSAMDMARLIAQIVRAYACVDV